MISNFCIMGINISSEQALYRKVGDQFYTATNIGLVFIKRGSETKLRYKVDGGVYDTLYVQEGEVMEAAPSDKEYVLKIEVGNTRNDRTEIRGFVCDETSEHKNLVSSGWVAKGTIERRGYLLPDGEYDCRLRHKSWAILDVALKGEEVGFTDKETAEFFNSYGVDGEQHLPKVDKFCPSRGKQELGLAAIGNLFKTLKDNGLRLVYDDETNRLGIINNDVEIEGRDRCDDGAVPHELVVPMFTNEQPLFVSECWSFAEKRA